MALNEKGYYLTVLLFGLFGVVSLQKSVRDRLEDVPVTSLYYGLCWLAVSAAVVLLAVGLWNAGLAPSEKGVLRDVVPAGAVRRGHGPEERPRRGPPSTRRTRRRSRRGASGAGWGRCWATAEAPSFGYAQDRPRGRDRSG